MAGRRHASGEIAAKLAQANELAAKGKTQREISKALGVSIMTYHRWRKLVNNTAHAVDVQERGRPDDLPDSSNALQTEDVLKRLELENARLRRLVTDMLLEKLRLDDELRVRREPPLGRPSKGK
jgi:putative transposase